jgi:hypothetical protein
MVTLWCGPCAQTFEEVAPDDLRCPRCAVEGSRVSPEAARFLEGDGDLAAKISLDTAGEEERAAVPWHFKMMVGALVLYLGWRIIQLLVAVL